MNESFHLKFRASALHPATSRHLVCGWIWTVLVSLTSKTYVFLIRQAVDELRLFMRHEIRH